MVDDERKTAKTAHTLKKVQKNTSSAAKPEVSDLIAQRLRRFYDEVAEQPVPDRFLDLLSQLDAASTPKKPD